MKRSLRNSILLLLTAMLLTVSALADSGPKAQLTVKVVNAPSEPYYLDLLEKGDYQGHTYGSGDGDDTYSGLDWSYSEEEMQRADTNRASLALVAKATHFFSSKFLIASTSSLMHNLRLGNMVLSWFRFTSIIKMILSQNSYLRLIYNRRTE